MGREEYLNLAVSDDGIIWNDILKLEEHEKGENSYPGIIDDTKGMVQITYNWNRSKTKHIKFLL